MSGSGCLPYWVRDQVHGKTMRLMYVWLERRSKDGYRPGTLCPPAVSSTEAWEVEEMGWAFMEMEEPKQHVLLKYFVRRGEDWKEFRRKERISRGKLNRLLLELQDLARARGLLEEEDRELIQEQEALRDPPPSSSDGKQCWVYSEEMSASRPLDGGH